MRRLEVAWTFSSGDLTNRRSEIQCNPIIIDAVLYCTSPQVSVFALRADTGELLWMYDPIARMEEAGRHANRGVVYWDDGGDDRRIFVVAGSMLHAVDALTGEPKLDFGSHGSEPSTSVRIGLSSAESDTRHGEVTSQARQTEFLVQ